MLHQESALVKERKNRSFASQKLEILAPVQLKESIAFAEKIIFVHPPKVGGTNLVHLTEALPTKYPAFKARRFAVPRKINQSPNLIKKNWQGGLQSALEALAEDPNCCDDLNFISGHFPFGLHEQFKKPAKYITLIRNPIERAISRTNFDFQRGYIEANQAWEYLLNAEIDNPQTRMLAGPKYMKGPCTEDTLFKVQENIQNHFLLVGITEETNLFIQVLASIQGFGPVALTRSQVTGDKILNNVDLSMYEALRNKHKYDLALYKCAKEFWMKFKNEYVGAPVTLSPTEKILCITPEFANTKKPAFLTTTEIENYNKEVNTDLVEVSQKHAGVQSDFSKTKLLYYGLGAAGIFGLGLFGYSMLRGNLNITSKIPGFRN